MDNIDKTNALIDYNERLKIRSENDILYDRLSSYFDIQIRNVIIIVMLIYFLSKNKYRENYVSNPRHLVNMKIPQNDYLQLPYYDSY